MRIHLCLVGRLRRGAEADLVSDYLKRFENTGKNLGLGPVVLHEVEAKKGGMAAEAALLARKIPSGAYVIALDERGALTSSPEFATKLANIRDQGREVAILIGGADGLAAELRAKADFKLSFGPMVWPHMLARVMLAEQLYRAASILAGSPYHRA